MLVIAMHLTMRKVKPLPSLELLEFMFDYDPQTGKLYKFGKEIGTVDRKGYRMIHHKRRAIPAHRIAWALYYREDPAPHHIEHINGCTFDNRIDNLKKRKPRLSPGITQGVLQKDHELQTLHDTQGST